MSWIIVTPAYGRDYKSKAEVLEVFNSNKDFVVASINHQHSGRYCNKQDLEKDRNISEVEIRYSKLRKLMVVDLKDNE